MATNIVVRCGEEKKNFMLYAGMPVEELTGILRAAFQLNEQIVGLYDPSEDVHFPLGVVSRAPSFFTTKPYYDLCVLFNEYDDDEEDDFPYYENPAITEKEMFSLTPSQTSQLLDLFLEAAPEGQLDRATFEAVFSTVLGDDISLKSTLFKLFDLFDRDGNGLVDAREFQTGLSVLGSTSGVENKAVREAFEAYDIDGNGVISIDEMITYLTSVFAVIATSSPEVFERNQVTPQDLAGATAIKCFEDLGVQTDGHLNFDQFQRWYKSSDSQNLITMDNAATKETSTALPSLDALRDITGLGGLDPTQVFRLFADHSGDSGSMSRQQFLACFEMIKPVESFDSSDDYSGFAVVVDQLFDIFDTDNNGVVDITELASGLSVLCGGSRDDKVSAAFRLFDINGDGYISKQEMITYLTSVFRVMYQSSQEAREVSPEVLAQATADQCFSDADINGDGRLSFEEFKYWYSESSGETESAVVVKKLEEINKIEEIKRLSNIESYDFTALITFFSSHATDDGFITRDSFFQCFKLLIDRNLYGTNVPASEMNEYVIGLLDSIFTLFDQDRNGVVDLSEIGAGLSVLCGGSRDEKVSTAFALYDEDEDGFISREELVNYLTSVYKVLFESSPETRESTGGATPLELAISTAKQCFQDVDADLDGLISFEEFKEWYNKPSCDEEAGEEECDFSFADMSTLTNLATTHVDTVFQMLAHCSDEDGILSQMSFNGCFRALIGSNLNEVDAWRVEQLLDFIFDMFDFNKEGSVSFDDLAGGISILCGGSNLDKIRAVFALHDIAGTGFITQAELTSHLTSVFTVLLTTSPSTKQRLGVTPNQFAQICAEEAFSSLNGQMSFSQFNSWCSDNIAGHTPTVAVETTTRSLGDIRKLSGLESANIVEVFEAFAECADARGLISRASFAQCLFSIMSLQGGVIMNELLVNELFDIFDNDGNGVVDFTELASGLSLLCGGSRDDKVSAAFRLFDINGDGYISKQEMVTYLTSVFRVIYATRPELYETLQVGPEELSVATTQEAFADADINHDGQISFFEFKNWYSQGIAGTLIPDDEEEDAQPVAEVSLDYVREASGLKNCDVHTMFAIFADAATYDGMLTCEAYFDCFGAMVQRASFPPDFDALNRMLLSIFRVYDIHGTERVELIEILCGMTVLCGGDREEKVRAAFSLIDTDNDGFISKEELFEYLRSIFRMLHDTKKRTGVEVDASTLAAATTEAAFQQAGTTQNGRISLNEFINWYSNAASFDVAADKAEDDEEEYQSDPSSRSNFERARWLLNMDKHSLNDLLDTLVEAGPDGTLTRAQFLNSMLMLVRLGGNLDPRTSEFEESAALMEAIFNAFDTSDTGRIDLSQVASGISILCAVPMSDKIQFAFCLYEVEGDGRVSFSALTEYMASVFKVLFVASPELKSMVDGQVDSERLAEVTTSEAFEEAGLIKSSTLGKQAFESFVRVGLGGI